YAAGEERAVACQERTLNPSAPSESASPQPNRYTTSNPARVVVLVSGSGTLLQALLDATTRPDYPVQVVAVGADRTGIEGLARAERAGVPTFTCRLRDYPSREDWDRA